MLELVIILLLIFLNIARILFIIYCGDLGVINLIRFRSGIFV